MLIHITSHGIHGTNWLINDDTWSHPTLGGYLYAAPLVAGTSNNDEIGAVGVWEESVSQSTDTSPQEDESDADKFSVPYWHKEGITTLRLVCRARREVTEISDPSPSTHEALITMSVGSVSGTVEPGGSWSTIELDLDITSLTPGDRYDVVINLSVEVGTPGTSEPGTATTTLEVEQAINILELT